jgi:hypothetical protein
LGCGLQLRARISNMKPPGNVKIALMEIAISAEAEPDG